MVVAPAALVRRSVVPDRHVAPVQLRLLDLLERDRDERVRLVDPVWFFVEVLGWRAEDLVTPTPDLTIVLSELGETLRPNWAVPEAEPVAGAPPWRLLIQGEPDGADLDAARAERATGWHASPQAGS
jgi:hypothetical protein